MDAHSTFAFKYRNITPNNVSAGTPLLLRTNDGVLHTITINRVPSTGGALTVYDNTAASGTVIATITMQTPAANCVQTLGTLYFGLQFTTGLTIACDQSLAGFDFTVTYI